MNTQRQNHGYLLSLVILGILYFIFGFVTWLNSSLIAYLKIACELNSFSAMLVAFAFYISYFVMALPSSFILKKTGFKNGMMIGLFVMAGGALLFLPASVSRNYSVFLLGLFVIGTGLLLLQTAVNPYVTILGPLESAAKRISIMGVCNKVAGMLAPVVLGTIILSNADKLVSELEIALPADKELLLNELASRVFVPYLIMAGILVFLGLMVRFSPLPEISQGNEETFDEADNSKKNIWQYPNLVLGVLAIFAYVGVEVLSIDTITLFGTSMGMSLSVAKMLPSYTLFAMTIGYLIGIIVIPRLVKQETMLSISAVLGIFLSFAAVAVPGSASVGFIILLGFANAVMWPAIWPLAIEGLGKFTKTGSAMLIMAIAGGALIPLLFGGISDLSGMNYQKAYWIMVPAYFYIFYYAVTGYKLKKW